MFSCDDLHPKILHEEYHCPLCDVLERLQEMQEQGYVLDCYMPAMPQQEAAR